MPKPGTIRRHHAPNERASLLDLRRSESTGGVREKTQDKIAFTTSSPTPFCKSALALMGRSLSRAAPASQRSGMGEQKMAAFATAWTDEGTMGTTPRRQRSKFDPSRNRRSKTLGQHEHIDVTHRPQCSPVDGYEVGGTQFPEARGDDLTLQDDPLNGRGGS